MAEHDSMQRMKNRADKVKGQRPLVTDEKIILIL